LTPKKVTTLYHPSYSPDLSPPDYFLFPKLKMTPLKDIAEIQETVTDELKKVQKEEFSAVFLKMYDHTNPVYMSMELILNNKSYVSSSCAVNLKKIQS
jgi:hypothetical protein